MHAAFRPRPILAVLLLALGVLASAHAAPGKTDTDKARQAQAQKKLDAVKAHIAALTHQQRETERKRDKLSAGLATQADKLDQAAKAVRQSDQAIAAKRAQLEKLDQQRAPIQAHLKSQRKALAELLRAAYALGRGSDLRLLLGDDDIARIGRALTYSRYFQHDRIQRIRSLMQDLAKLQTIEDAIGKQQQALETERAQRKQHVQALSEARDHQRALLAQARERLKQQGKQMQQLKRNQKDLNQLIARLADVFADIPQKLPDDTPFSKRRGHLPWPAKGKLSTSGKGVSIDAKRGSPVRAVAHGRIAFANWMRGYGMLIIIDHGNGWMSLYGDNESLLPSVGDWVNAGDRIGTAGVESGGHEGVYFALRHKGKPVHPKSWLSSHH